MVMASNRAIYDRAMEQNREAARQNRWEEALKGAVRALQEFPQDTDARTAAAVALFHTNKLDKALQILKELHAKDANNPYFLEYLAKTYEGQGNIDAAVQMYQSLVEVHQKRRAAVRTISALREILRLRPDMDAERKRLAELLQETNAISEAVAEHMTLARRYRGKGNLDEAAASTEVALRLEPQNREAKELMAALHEGMARAAGMEPEPSSGEGAEPAFAGAGKLQSSGGSGLRSQQFALEKIVANAVELQQNGDQDGALKEYERAIDAGLKRADVFYSVGLIYQERGDLSSAISMLSQATTDPEYALSSHYALGGCYKERNQLQQAAQEYEQAIRLVDLETIGKAEVEDLIQMYENVVDIHQHLGDHARAASLYSTLASFLQGKRWGKERAAEFNRRAKDLTEQNMLAKLRSLGTGMLTPPAESVPAPRQEQSMPETWGKIRPITDFLRSDKTDTTDNLLSSDEPLQPPDPLADIEDLPASESSDVKPIIAIDTEGLDENAKRWALASERYLEQGLLESALDACHEVIRLNIDYLPIHIRQGEIFERQLRPKEALAKYQILIDTFEVREELEHAIEVYFRAIELSPDVVNMRSNLADLLHRVNRVEEAAEQLSLVAANYFRMGQTNKALEEYRRVLQWAPKNKMVRGEYGMVLFKLERYEAALGEFQKALETDAEDVTTIARINMTLASIGEQPATIWDSLATLLEKIKAQPQLSNLVQAEYRAGLLVADVPILHYILAIIQQYSNQHSSALFELEQAQQLLEMESSPLLPAVLVHQTMADSYIALGQAENALEQLRQGQAVASEARLDENIKHSFAVPLSEGDLVRRMAEAYAASDDLDGAEQALLEARRLLPYDRAIYTKLADVYFRQGKLNEAITQLIDLADHYENNQYLDQAIETLQDALKLAPNNIAIGSKLARLNIRRGYPDKGVEGLMRVAELQRKAGQLKDAVASLQQVAEILWMQGKQEEVRKVYDRIVQIAPNDIEARQWLAIMHTLAFRTKEAIAEKKEIVRIFAEQRDYDNAIAELHQIIGLDQKDQEAYFLLGDMLMRRGEYNQTIQLYNRMLKMEGVEVERVEALLAAANRMLEQQKIAAGG